MRYPRACNAMILTQQSEFHPLSVHTKPHVGSTEHPHLGLCSASPMVKLRSASSAARSFRATSPAKTTNEGKGHFINHPRGVGFVASLSKCNVGTLQKTGPKYCPALKKKKLYPYHYEEQSKCQKILSDQSASLGLPYPVLIGQHLLKLLSIYIQIITKEQVRSE